MNPRRRVAPRQRLDEALVARGLCPSREQAQRLIRAGAVFLDQQLADKPGRRVDSDASLVLAARSRYVSRGGEKLEHALRHFALPVANRVALDLGASTGGFTDCLLQHGAAQVCAIDVGRGQLAWTLRQDPRVVVMEGVNVRHLTRAGFPPKAQPADLAVVDCSFISLRMILPSAVELLEPCATIIALIKPQFEAGRTEAARGRGVITDAAVHERVLAEIEHFARSLPCCHWIGVTLSPLRGPAGNQEFLARIDKTS
jgi:23S rRNA (cytidine1920-2'-O)/16S rRNA (cytidine1409-2'-O)-methyltransferase